MSRDIESHETVNLPYDLVRTHLAPLGDAGKRLHATIGGVEVGVDIVLVAGAPRERLDIDGARTTLVGLTWKARRAAGAFPVMAATLSVYPVSPTLTQLDLEGTYQPPLGSAGDAADAVVGHRVAEQAVRGFLKDLALRLTAAV
jgi:hypothetical protein